MRCAVIGGGISGLAAAYQLRKRGLSPTLFEAGDRLGGSIQTLRRDGYLMEAGPDSLLVTKPAAIKLAKELGLELIPSTSLGPPGVVKNERIEPLPEGFRLLAPTKLLPFLRTPLLSLWGKIRAGLECLIPATEIEHDESVADFVTRRFGQEVLDTLAQPLIGGIYAADPRCLSLLATMPMFRQMEKARGSILAGMLRQVRKAGSRPGSLFVTPENGMGSLVDALAEQLDDIRLNAPVEVLRQVPTGWQGGEAGRCHTFQAVILACSAPQQARLLAFAPELAEQLSSIRTTTTATIQFLFEQSQMGTELRGSGFVVPHTEGYQMTACTYSHLKYQGRAPEGQAILRCHLGNAMNQTGVELPDGELSKLALEELESLLKLKGPPRETVLVRHREALPQYQVGHRDRVAEINALRRKYPQLALAGNGLEGVGVSDCVSLAQKAVDSLRDTA